MRQRELVERLYSRAEAAGLSMAELCRRSGVSASTPSYWRAGRGMSMRVYERMLDVLDEAEVAKRAA